MIQKFNHLYNSTTLTQCLHTCVYLYLPSPALSHIVSFTFSFTLPHSGVAEVSGLFCYKDMSVSLKNHYISLLEKFEVALKINSSQMIIPSLMPEQTSYPTPSVVLSDVAMLGGVDDYLPPLCRFWLADYMPDGFWPRLICRVATDPQISHVRYRLFVCVCVCNMT